MLPKATRFAIASIRTRNSLMETGTPPSFSLKKNSISIAQAFHLAKIPARPARRVFPVCAALAGPLSLRTELVPQVGPADLAGLRGSGDAGNGDEVHPAETLGKLPADGAARLLQPG